MQGKIIVLEGIDGSGKNTHAQLLNKFLLSLKINSKVLHFPLYQDTFFGKEVANYLNGEFGELNKIHPKLAAMLYAGDRFEKREYILDELKKGTVFIFDRYVPSNIAHHAAKLHPSKRECFKEWIEKLEYIVFKLPPPDKIFFLNVPPQITMPLILNKKQREYTDKKQDLHEENIDYLDEVYTVFKSLCKGNLWENIDCCFKDKIKPVEEIQKVLCSKVVTFLKSYSTFIEFERIFK